MPLETSPHPDAVRRFASFGGATVAVIEPAPDDSLPAAGRSLHDAASWSNGDEIDAFEAAICDYLDGTLDPEDFRRRRLNLGVYGIRQVTDIHMIRAKLPGGSLTAEKLEAFADVAETYSRGWGHLTTRQNVQFHFVALADAPAALRRLATAGITTREACGDAVRNVTACHLAGVCPLEKLDVNPAVEQVTRYLLRNPIASGLPRKFKIAFSGCALDCALSGIHDVGVVAVEHDGRTGYRLFVGGGLGSDPHEAQVLEPFTAPADLIRTVEAVLRVFDRETPDRTKRARVRMKFLVERLGIERFRELVLVERETLPLTPIDDGDPQVPATSVAPAAESRRSHPVVDSAQFGTWRDSNVIAQRQPGRYSVYAAVRLGDLTTGQFRELARLARELGVEWRVTVRQNLVARDVRADDLPALYGGLLAAGLGSPGAEQASSVVSCPGAETCNLALTASRGVGAATIDALAAAGLSTAPVSINVSGCPNSCGQQQLADIGLSGQVRRVAGEEAPGYRILLGGRLTEGGAQFGRYLGKAPAKVVPQLVVGLVRRFSTERRDGERFAEWFDRTDQQELRRWLATFDSRQTKEQAPDLFTDWGASGPFTVILGRGECAS